MKCFIWFVNLFLIVFRGLNFFFVKLMLLLLLYYRYYYVLDIIMLSYNGNLVDLATKGKWQ